MSTVTSRLTCGLSSSRLARAWPSTLKASRVHLSPRPTHGQPPSPCLFLTRLPGLRQRPRLAPMIRMAILCRPPRPRCCGLPFGGGAPLPLSDDHFLSTIYLGATLLPFCPTTSCSLSPTNHEPLMLPQATWLYVFIVSVCPPRSDGRLLGYTQAARLAPMVRMALGFALRRGHAAAVYHWWRRSHALGQRPPAPLPPIPPPPPPPPPRRLQLDDDLSDEVELLSESDES